MERTSALAGVAERMKPILDLVGAAAVFLGLAFVGLEIRQNTNAVRGATLQSIGEMSLGTVLLLAEDDELNEAFRIAMESGAESLTPHQASILTAFTTGALRIVEARFRQIELGILDEDDSFVAGGASTFYRSDWFADWWEASGRGESSPDLVAWVEATLLARN